MSVHPAESIKHEFATELEPLLIAIEQAVIAEDGAKAQRLSLETLRVVQKYAQQLSRADIHDVLNSPTASAIAKRLGVQGL